MKTISSTDAQNNFGELLASLDRGAVRISRNGRPIAMLVPLPATPKVESDSSYTQKLLLDYSEGKVRRADLQDQTGLTFGDVLFALASARLPLPRFRSSVLWSTKQQEVFKKVFAISSNSKGKRQLR